MFYRSRLSGRRLYCVAVAICLFAFSSPVAAQPSIDAPALLQFPNTPVNLTATLTMSVGNTGPDPLVVSSISTNYADFTADLSSFSVPPGGNVDVIVTHAPTGPGQKNKTLSITHDGPSSPTTVDLKGRGLNVSAISTPAAFDFGNVAVGNSGTATVQVSNGGSAALNISAVTLSGGDAADFSVTPTSVTVAAGGSENLTVTFTPSAPAAHAATMTLSHDGPEASTDVSLTGTGTAPQLSVNGSLDLGSSPVSVPTTATLTVSNPGNAALTVSSHALSGGDAAAFAVSPASLSVPAGNAADLTVTFIPPASGAHAATLTLTHDASGNSTAVSLAGTGTSPLISAVSTLALGNSPISTSTSGTITVSNPGNASLTVSAIALSGGDAAAFTASPASLSISPGDAATLTITFTPAAAGARAATLTLTHNAPGNSSDISLTGFGTAAQISVASALLIGETQASTSIVRTLTVANPGDATLHISAVALSGGNAAAYAVSPSTLSISSGGDADLSITFDPAVPGVHVATLTLTHNAAGGWTETDLSGTATSKPASQEETGVDIVAPSSLDFGSTPAGNAASKNLTIRNGSTSKIDIQSIAILGEYAAYFNVSESSVILSPGGAVDLTVSFSPDEPGARNASLVLTKLGSVSPYTIALGGTGVGAIVSAPDELDFGAVDLAQPANETVRVTNPGNATLTIDIVGFTGNDPSAFSVHPRSSTVAPGAYVDFLVEFSPERTELHDAELSFAHNARGGNWRIAVTGVGTEVLTPSTEPDTAAVDGDTLSVVLKPVLVVADSVDLGTVEVGATATQSLTLVNSGNALLSLSNIRFESAGSPVTIEPTSLQILPGAQADLTITYTPLEAVDLTGHIVLYCGVDGLPCRVLLTGTGTLPQIDISTSSVDVGTVARGQSTSMSILVSNPGNVPLIVTRANTLASEFEVSPESFVLEAEGVQVITVQYTPSSLGTTTSELVLQHNGPGGDIILPVIGRAVVQSDLNNDGRTDVEDFIMYITGYYSGASSTYDVDDNGLVNSDDLIYFLTTFM